MASIMKGKITRNTTKLRKTLENLKDQEEILRTRINEATNYAHHKEIILTLEDIEKRLEMETANVNSATDDFAKFIESLTTERRETEETRLTEMLEQDGGANDVMDEALEQTRAVKLLLDAIRRKTDTLNKSTEPPPENEDTSTSSITTGTHRQSPPRDDQRTASPQEQISDASDGNRGRQNTLLSPSRDNNVSLPKVRLPVFNGRKTEFFRFWSLFESLVDSNNSISEAVKLHYLLSSLNGEAAEVVGGITFDARNYENAKKILKERFGSKDTMERQLFNQLFNLKCRGRSAKDAREMVDKMEVILDQMKTFGIDTETESIRMAMEKATPKWMDPHILQSQISQEKWTTESLRATMKKLATTVGQRETDNSEEVTTIVPAINKLRKKEIVRKMPPNPNSKQRFPEKKGNSSCHYCGKPGHFVAECRSRIRDMSQKKSEAHLNNGHKRQLQTTGAVATREEEIQRMESIQLSTPSENEGEAPLMCCEAPLVNMDNGNRVKALIFFDSGSQGSYVSRQVAEVLELEESDKGTLRVNTFAGDKKDVTYTKVVFGVQQLDGSIIRMPAKKVERVVNRIPTVRIQPGTEELIKEFRIPSVIIGNDYLFEFVQNRTSEVINGYRCIQSTLGKLLAGPPSENHTNNVTAAIGVDSSVLDHHLEQWNSLESIGIMDQIDTDEDKEAWEHLKRTTTFRDHRYHVSLPFKTDNPRMPDNLGLCVKQLIAWQQRTTPNCPQRKHAEKIVEEWMDEKVIEEVPKEELSTPKGPLTVYHPFHLVKKETSTSTPFRLVHNGSAHKKGSPSLNKLLCKGPVFTSNMISILLRSREAACIGIADVRKAFLQLGLNEPDRDCLRFVYPRNWSQPITRDNLIHYRFRRVNFGLVSSPFLLAGVLKIHFERNGTELDKELLRNTYVDNVMLIGTCPSEVDNKMKYAEKEFNKAGMELSHYFSSNATLNSKWEQTESETTFLGIRWNLKEDKLLFNFRKIDLQDVTKRKLLSQIHQRFDPLGLTFPLQLHWKLAIQRLWKTGTEWDEKVDEKTIQKLSSLNEEVLLPINLPRRTLTGRDMELHIFVDASKDAFAATAYYKTENKVPNLAMSRARLTPAKGNPTIPKLELLGALIGAKLAKFIQENTSCNITRTILWSDSMIVLNWIITEDPDVPVFNRRRLEEIRSLVKDVRYVPSNLNPADIATRGSTALVLRNCNLWWHGPEFLAKPETEWPKHKIPRKTEETIAAAATPMTPYKSTLAPERFSSWDRYISTLMTILVFIKKLGKERFQFDPSREATRHAIIEMQKRIPPSKDDIRKLDLFQDDKGVWRSKGRLENSNLPITTKHPAFLPRDDYAVHLLIMHIHKRMAHGSTPSTLATLRTEYWLPKGRATIRKIISKCERCRKMKSKPFALPPTPALPMERVTECIPFHNVGVDLAGPFQAKLPCGDKIKTWFVIFTCLASRCCHLEIANSLSSIEFLRTLRRFVARRGRPMNFWSDNGTNFRGAVDTIKGWTDEQGDVAYCEELQVKWHFIPSLSPWTGGFYERMVSIVKTALRRTIPKKLLLVEELETFLIEAEAVVNCRPLLYVSDEQTILRPIDLLTPRMKPGVPLTEDIEEDLEPDHNTLVGYWTNTKARISTFWEIWKREYLTALRERTKNSPHQPRSTTHRQPEVGEVVLLEEPNQQRAHWKIGRITKVNPSRDKEIRSVDVQISNGRTVRRSIAIVHPLEIRPGNDQSAVSRKSEDLTEDSITNTPAERSSTDMEKPRYNLRPRKPKQTMMYFIAILATLFLQVDTHSCQGELIFQQKCAKSGYAITKTNNSVCWEWINCKNGSLRSVSETKNAKDGKCGNQCRCPNWAIDCVHEVRATENWEKWNKQIESVRPDVNYIPTSDNNGWSLRDIPVVMLPDGSLRYVTKLDIIKQQTDDHTPFTCYGKGLITGDSTYCRLYPCNQNGTQICIMDHLETAVLKTTMGEVPILAWGLKNVKVYHKIPERTIQTCSYMQSFCHHTGGVGIDGISRCSPQFLDICIQKSCTQLAHSEFNLIKPPRTLRLTEHTYQIRAWKEGKMIWNQTLTCQPQNVCALINCWICWEALLESHCFLENLLIGLIGSTIIIGIIMIVRRKRCCIRTKRKLNRVKRSPTRITPRRTNLIELIPLLIAFCISTSESCGIASSFQATQHKCEISRTGTVSCTFSETTVITLLDNTETCLVLKDPKGRTISRIRLSTVIQHTCHQRTSFYTYPVRFSTYTIRRCPGLGSCVSDYCLRTSWNTSVSEFGEYNKLPGFSQCEEACSSLTCGCIPFGTGCRFSRTVADIDTTTGAIKIIGCTWERELVLTVQEETAGTLQSSSHSLRAGEISRTKSNLTIALHSMEISLDSLLHKDFALRNNEVTLLSTEGRNAAELLQCSSKNLIQCQVNAAAQTCRTADGRVTCTPPDNRRLTDVFPRHRLPLMYDERRYGGNTTMITAFSRGSATIQIDLNGYETILETERSKCSMDDITIEGCRSCPNGATISYSCSTDFGVHLAEVDCPSSRFTVKCGPGRTRVTTAYFDIGTINEECSLRCPGSKTTFRISGKLTFLQQDDWTKELLRTEELKPSVLKEMITSVVETVEHYVSTTVQTLIVVLISIIILKLIFKYCV